MKELKKDMVKNVINVKIKADFIIEEVLIKDSVLVVWWSWIIEM